jgi:predicted DNA-binding protein
MTCYRLYYRREIMSSIRLPKDVEDKVTDLAEMERTTKSEIIKRALRRYFESFDQEVTPFELGKDLFGRNGSGKGSLSQNYKKIIKENLREKHAR